MLFVLSLSGIVDMGSAPLLVSILVRVLTQVLALS